MDDRKRQRIGGHHQNNRGWKLCSHNMNGSDEEEEEEEIGIEEDGGKETESGEEDLDHAYCRQKAGNHGHGHGHDHDHDQKGKEEHDHGEKEDDYYDYVHDHGQCDRETNRCESHGHGEKEEGEGHGHGHGQENEEDHGHSGDEEKQCPGEHDHAHDERLLQPLLPGLDDETSLRCISLLPIRDLRKLALLSVRHRTLLKSGAMFEIRRNQCSFEEHFIFLSLGSDPSVWAVYDVREDTCESLSPVHAYASSAHLESICIVNHVIWYDPIGNFDYRYDHLMKQWEEAPPMVNRRSLFASASSPGNFAYVAGGLGRPHRRHTSLREEASVNALQTAEVYDARMNRWSLIPPMPAPRFKCSGVIMNGKFYVIGGKDANNKPLSSAEEYDILTRTWRTIEDMYLIKSRADIFDCMPPLVAVLQNRLYAVEVNTSTLKVYENHLNTWKDVSKLPILADIGNGCGVMFKALGDHGLLIMGDLGDLLFGCCWSPGESSEWRVLCHINVQPTFHGCRFLCNCPVMSC